MNPVTCMCKGELKRELITKHNSESQSKLLHLEFV